MHTHETIYCCLQKNKVEFKLLSTINRIHFQQDRGVVLKAVSAYSLPSSGNFHSLLTASLFRLISLENPQFFTLKKKLSTVSADILTYCDSQSITT